MRYLYFLIPTLLLLTISSLSAQQRLPQVDLNGPGVPAWFRMMYDTRPNAWEIDRLYAEEHPVHRMEGNRNEEYAEREYSSIYDFIYQRWRKTVQDWLDEDGYVHYPTVQQLEDEDQFRRSLRSTEERGGSLWTLAGPLVHYRARYNASDSVPAASWHSNVYSITRCQANPNILYCGTEAGGVYKSTDHGASWNIVSLSEYVRDVRAIEVHPGNPDIALYGARGKVYRTTNGGGSWATVGQAGFQSLGLYVWDLHFNPSNPNMIYAATDGGLYRTTDLGNNWTQILTEECISVVTQPGNDAVVYTIQHNPATGIGDFYKSADSGATFVIKPTGWFTVPVADAGLIDSKGGRIAVSEDDPNRVYCLLVGQSQAAANLQLHGFIGVYKSTDAGETWSNPHTTIGAPYNGTTHPNPMTFTGDNGTYNQIYYNTTIVASQLNADEIIFGGLSLWRSTDGAASYTSVGGYVGNVPYIHPDMQELKTFKTGTSAEETWLACDGGINLSTDFFQSHRARNYGLGAGDFWGFDQGWNEDIMVGGRYHNGNAGYNETYPSGDFLSLGGGEAPTGYVNYSNERRTLYSDIDGVVLPDALTDIPTTFGTGLMPNEGYWLNESSRILFDDRYWNKAYMGYLNRIYHSNDGGVSFAVLDSFGTSASRVYWIEQCKMQPDVMYAQVVVSNNSRLYKSTDSGDNWTQITIPQTNRRYLFFTVSATNPDEVWVAYTNGSNGNKVYHTTNSGTNWTNITTSVLDNQEIYQIVHQAGTDGGVYVAVKEGAVYYRNNSMSNWTNYSSGLPVAIEPLRMVPFYRESKIRLCTKGHSIWEAPLYEPSVLIADFSADYKEFYCPGDTVHFVDHSVCSDSAIYNWNFTGGANPIMSNLKYPKVVYYNPGSYQVRLVVTDGAAVDTMIRTMFISSATSASGTPLEGFESGAFVPDGWKHQDAGNDHVTWMLKNNTGGYGQSANCMYFDNYYNDVQGKRDGIRTKKYNFGGIISSWLKFDVAYAFYGAGYEDTLAVLCSTNCGDSFDTLYVKGGVDLSTAGTFNSGLFEPGASQWRTDSIYLGMIYMGANELFFVFENRGHYGQGVYVDNINLDHVMYYDAIEESEDFYGLSLYPNPSSGHSWLKWESTTQGLADLKILDIQGRLLDSREINLVSGTNLVPLKLEIANGTYLITIGQQGRTVQTLRWIINR